MPDFLSFLALGVPYMGVPTGGPIDLKQLSTEELLRLLPTEKIKKRRGKPLEATRSPEERIVIDELWDRYLAYHIEKKREGSIRFMCPRGQSDETHFYKTAMHDAYDAFSRLVRREDIDTDFSLFVFKMVKNKALDLRRKLKGRKPRKIVPVPESEGSAPQLEPEPPPAITISYGEIEGTKDVCQRLRMSKHSRQFIFTTHNSSVAVASDSDQFIVMEADADRGWVAEAGSIDQAGIKKRVVDHLEGGASSYHLKRRKYNI